MADLRSIVHMDLDTFFVSCERLLDSRLNGKPILIGGTSDRGVVASCSYEARKFGIHSAMPMKMAKERCSILDILLDIFLKQKRIILTKFYMAKRLRLAC